MGEVRHARDRRLSRDVAIKFLRDDLASQPDVRERFANEARNAARLTHANVVLVLDTGEYAGVPYLVMERLPGATLRDELKDGPLSEARATVIARDVLAGLIAAHELGVVHRDIAPSNILLTADGHAKIADFGIAKSAEGLSITMVGQVLGTPAYMAPERLHGEPATPSTDVYALGVVLYEALTGVRPFAGDTPVAVASSVMSTTPEPLAALRPDLDPNMAAAVDGAMAKDPAHRIPTASAMLDTLTDGTARTTVIPVVVSPVRRRVAPRWRRAGDWPRDVWLTIAVVVAVGLLLLGVATRSTTGTADETATTQAPVVTTTVAPPPVTTESVVQPSGTPSPKGGHGKEKHGHGDAGA
jgi:serine/threonine protein kinase